MNTLLHNKIKGAVYGLVVGDILGKPLQYMSAEEINNKFSDIKAKLGTHHLVIPGGIVSDASDLSIMVGRGVIESPNDPVEAIGRNFIIWYRTKHVMPADSTNEKAIRQAMHKSYADHTTTKDEWMWCADLVEHRREGKPPSNGALKRTIYPAVYYPDTNDLINKTEDIAKMTHSNEESTEVCIYYVEDVASAIKGSNGPFNTYYKNENDIEYNYDGAVYSYSSAIKFVNNTKSFEDAVTEAIKNGGDVSSIAAITGGLAGAVYGYDNIPEKWLLCIPAYLKIDLDILTERAYHNQLG